MFLGKEGLMNRRDFLGLLAGSAAAAAMPRFARGQAARKKPNIIFILADDLGYGDVGCYGQKQIRTPSLDRMAAEGIRFTDAYAGSTVCAPSRCALMTGYHMGHALIRGNGRVPLRPEDVTVAELLKQAGYATGIIGKWGLGEARSTGIPNRQGFDYWLGYLNQHRAHNYYPDFLWKNTEKFPLPNEVERNVATKRVQYSHDLFTKEALAFVERSKDKPFFLYLAYTIPHANNEAGRQGMEVPSDEPYSDEKWPQQQKNHAAMITRMDRDIGRLLDLLEKLGIDDDTIVFFSSDNGPHREGGANPNFFDSNGPLRGIKRDLYEGGIRVPMIVRWPGKAKAGATSAEPWAFWDFLPTACAAAGIEAPKGIDGISMLPSIRGEPQRHRHEYLYWEFHERGFTQAVRMGRWKAVRKGTKEPIELYDLTKDIGEKNNIADEHPNVVAKVSEILKAARVDSKHWPIRERRRRRPKRKKKS